MSTATVQYTTTSGVTVEGDLRGDPSASPAILLHGGGQTRHAWGSTAATLTAQGWRTLSLDARGHGRSGWPNDGDYSLTAFATDLRDVIEQLGGTAPPVLIGASLGGLTSLLLEGELWPGTARALACVDVAPRLEEVGTERIRAFMDQPDGFVSLEEAADAIAAYNPHRERPSDLAGLMKNLRLGEDGRYRWHWDPVFMSGGRGTVGGQRLRADASLRRRAALPGAAGARTDERLLSEEGAARVPGGGAPRAVRGRVRRRAHGGRRPQRRVHGRTGGLPRRPPRGVAGTTTRHAG